MVKTMTHEPDSGTDAAAEHKSESAGSNPETTADKPADPNVEIGGRGGLNPTRYGDWEKNGRCIDF